MVGPSPTMTEWRQVASESYVPQRINPPRIVAGDQLHDHIRTLDRAENLRDPAVNAQPDPAAEQQLAEIVQLGEAKRGGRIELLGELPHFQCLAENVGGAGAGVVLDAADVVIDVLEDLRQPPGFALEWIAMQ